MYDFDSNVELLLRSAAALPKGDIIIWRRHHFVWKQPETWAPQLTAWLLPHFRKDGFRRLKPGRFRDLSWDDLEWRDLLGRCLRADLEYHTDHLADALAHATLRTYHGCRTDDAGSYFREGLHVHDRAHMTEKLRSIVEKNREINWLAPRLEEAIAEINNALDIGRLYVVADDTSLLKYAAHYLIYGSEWIAAVLGCRRCGFTFAVIAAHGRTLRAPVSGGIVLRSKQEPDRCPSPTHMLSPSALPPP